MKHGWEYKKIGEVCEVSAGQGAPQGEQSYCENGTPFIKAGNLEDLVNGLDEGNVQKVSQSIAQKHKLKLYKAGSVLFAKSGMSCMKGYVHVLQRDCYVVSHLSILTPKTIEGHFLKYYLRFTKTYSLVKDEAYPSISLSDIASFPVPVPALAVQERIVGELDKVSEIIEKKKQQVKGLDSLAQSMFYDMFGDPVENEKGWEVKKMNEVGEIVAGSTPSTTDSENWDGEINWVTPAELGSQLYYGETQRKLTEKGARGLAMMPIGTVLLSSRAPIGKLAITTVEMCCNQGFKNIVCKDFVNNIFLYHYLLYTIDEVKALGVGATFKEVSKKAISAYKVILPPLDLQQSFAQKIEAIEKQKELITASLKEAETLFDARMEYWFGE